jgi:hypothetical protein
MISKALMGCRLENKQDGQVEGTVVGFSIDNTGSSYFLVMHSDGTFADASIGSVRINKEDYRKVMAEERPEPFESIESRSDILDL